MEQQTKNLLPLASEFLKVLSFDFMRQHKKKMTNLTFYTLKKLEKRIPKTIFNVLNI